MSELLVEDAVGAVVRARTGSAVSAVRPVAGFVGNQNFLVDTSGGGYVLKAGDARGIAAEAWVCERVRREGVPAPEVLAVDLDRGALPLPFLLMRQLEGRPVEVGEDAVLTEVGRQLRIVHALTLPGFGLLHVSPSDEGNFQQGRHATWGDALSEPLGALDALVAHHVLAARLADRLRTAVDAHRALLDGTRRGALLHGDLHPRHIFAADGGLSGLIDWGDVAVGDPAFDLGRFSRDGDVSLRQLLRGYEPDDDPDLERRIVFYRVVWSLLAIRWEFDAGGDWFAGHVEALAAGLDTLDALADGFERGPRSTNAPTAPTRAIAAATTTAASTPGERSPSGPEAADTSATTMATPRDDPM